jgi:hypothetical protein
MTSLKVEVSKETSERIVDVISDIFSPATEFLGAIADKIRIFRVKAALRTLRGAQQIASENGFRKQLHGELFAIVVILLCAAIMARRGWV